jgi:hypothetical protein
VPQAGRRLSKEAMDIYYANVVAAASSCSIGIAPPDAILAAEDLDALIDALTLVVWGR